jgi:very-short-patch-repair endonuclease
LEQHQVCMADQMLRNPDSPFWRLVSAQHGVVTRSQLLGLGFSKGGITHRIKRERFHPIHAGVYAVGRPSLDQNGLWMAAVLACGPEAVLSHLSAGAHWGLISRPWVELDVRSRRAPVHVTVPARCHRRRPGVIVHRRGHVAACLTSHDGIPVTEPAATLVDLATLLARRQLEAAVNEADKLELIDPDALRAALDGMRGRAGSAALRRLLEESTLVVTDSELERRFLPLARRAGLGPPRTQARVNGYRVDFYWPELGLIVETDGLRYHRTPAQQSRDRQRDQCHAAAGLTTLRFTHPQVTREPEHVCSTLAAVAARLRRGDRSIESV